MDANTPQWVTTGIVILGGALSIGIYKAKLDHIFSLCDTLAKKLENINTYGTAASKATMALDHQILIQHGERLNRLEDVGTKLAIITTTLKHVEEAIAEIKKRNE